MPFVLSRDASSPAHVARAARQRRTSVLALPLRDGHGARRTGWAPRLRSSVVMLARQKLVAGHGSNHAFSGLLGVWMLHRMHRQECV